MRDDQVKQFLEINTDRIEIFATEFAGILELVSDQFDELAIYGRKFNDMLDAESASNNLVVAVTAEWLANHQISYRNPRVRFVPFSV